MIAQQSNCGPTTQMLLLKKIANVSDDFRLVHLWWPLETFIIFEMVAAQNIIFPAEISKTFDTNFATFEEGGEATSLKWWTEVAYFH